MGDIHQATVQASKFLLVLTPPAILALTLIGMAAVIILLNQNPSPKGLEEIGTAQLVSKARDVAEICAIFGYACEDHSVVTNDGYILSLKRIVPRDETSSQVQRPVVFLQHGLCTNCELFMAVSDARRCLPLVLVENGYDVWLGNNRGNKYSKKHQELETSSSAFWDFSIDDLALSDVPSSVSYVLKHTNLPKLSYIGFSQGSAQAFAALSVNKKLNDQLDVFIALAPIMRPKGYSFKIVDWMTKRNPRSLHTIFGSCALFPIVSTLQRLLPTHFLHLCVDYAVFYLLAFSNRNITKLQKRAAYTHLYCASSVKAVVQWGQVMKVGEFVRLGEEATVVSKANMLNGDANGKGHAKWEKFKPNGILAPTLPFQVPHPGQRYPTEHIRTPIVLIHGDSDSLFDVEPVLERLPSTSEGDSGQDATKDDVRAGSARRTVQPVRCIELKGYEHLDVLWGSNVHVDVIPRVLDVLQDVPR